jgi:hypothetical protein
MSRNLGALNFWNPVGLFRPVMGQIYVLPLIKFNNQRTKSLGADDERSR